MSEEQENAVDLIMQAHTILYSTDSVYRTIVDGRSNLTDGSKRPVTEWSFAEWQNCLEEYHAVKNTEISS